MGKKVIEKNCVLKMKEAVGFETNNVVRIDLLSEKNGTVALFALDAGQGLSDNTAPFDALAYVVEGYANIIIDNKENHLHEGEFMIMPANTPHAVFAERKLKLQVIMIKS